MKTRKNSLGNRSKTRFRHFDTVFTTSMENQEQKKKREGERENAKQHGPNKLIIYCTPSTLHRT